MAMDYNNIHIPDGIRVNEIILQYLATKSVARAQEIEKFIQASNRTDVLIMEVFKGLIASGKV